MAPPRVTLHALLVLRALAGAPGRELYGTELIRLTGLSSGTAYPLLHRLEGAGWLESRAEDIDPRVAERPRRRYYRLTEAGAAKAREETSRADALLRALGAAPG